MTSNKPIPPHVMEARKHLHQAEQRAQMLVDVLRFHMNLYEEIENIRATIEDAQDALADSPPNNATVLRLADQPE